MADFIRARVISKSNYKDYFNIRFLDLPRPDCGIYFRKGDFWSFDKPLLRQDQHHQDDPPLPVQPPPEIERRGHSSRDSRQVSPYMTQEDALKSYGVCMLPHDDMSERLSPRSKKRARKLHLPPEQEYMRSSLARALSAKPGDAKPQSRVVGFLDKLMPSRK